MEQEKHAPREGGANEFERPQETASRRLPRADGLKRANDAGTLHAAERPHGETLATELSAAMQGARR